MNKKDLNLPGFPENTLLVSVKALQNKVLNNIMDQDEFTFINNWLQHNWVTLDELEDNKPIYAKPYSRFDYKYMLASSQENTDELLKNLTKKSVDAYKISNTTYSASKK